MSKIIMLQANIISRFFFFTLSVLFCAGVATSSSANTASAKAEAWWLDGSWPHEKSELTRHDSAIFNRLQNGFRYIIEKKHKPEGRVSINLVVQVGSLMETEEEAGVAHFLEHLAFNGSTHFPSGALIPFFQKNGIAFGKDLNAHTSMLETVYKLDLANTSAENIAEALLFLRDVADGIIISPKEVEKERGVILSEKAARDSERFQARLRLFNTFYQGTSFAKPTIGNEKNIKTVSAVTIADFYKAWYRPELIYLAVAGDISDETAVEQQIRTAFSDFKAKAPRRKLHSWGDVQPVDFTSYYDPYESKTTVVRLQLQTKRRWQDDSLAVQQQQVNEVIVSDILSSRFQQKKAEGAVPWLKAMAGMPTTFNVFPSAYLMAITTPDKWEQTLSFLQEGHRQALIYGFCQKK